MLVAKWELVFSELTAENKGVKNPLAELTGAGHFPDGLLRTTNSTKLVVTPSTALAQLVGEGRGHLPLTPRRKARKPGGKLKVSARKQAADRSSQYT